MKTRFIAFLSPYIQLINVLIYSAAQLQECLINLLTYLLTYLLAKQEHSESVYLYKGEFGPNTESVSRVRIRTQDPDDFQNLMVTLIPFSNIHLRIKIREYSISFSEDMRQIVEKMPHFAYGEKSF